MNVLALNPGNIYTIEKFPAIEDSFRNIPLAKKALDAFDTKTFVAAFTTDGWLLSDFGTIARLRELDSIYMELSNG